MGRYNITFNAICPGVHEAQSLELARAQAEYRGEPFDEDVFRSRFRARQQDNTRVIAGRWCADEGYAEKGAGPKDAASIALFLASDEAAYLTEQDINSGGSVMW